VDSQKTRTDSPRRHRARRTRRREGAVDSAATNVRSASHGSQSTLMWCTTPCRSRCRSATPSRTWETASSARRRAQRDPLTINDIPPGHPGKLHRTETVDYALILAGEIDMEVDDGERISLNPGDVVIQRGTNHSWINRGTTWGRIAFILIDAVPLGIGHPLPRSSAASGVRASRKSLRDVAASALGRLRPESTDLTTHDIERLREEMQACIDGHGGDVATRGRAALVAPATHALAGRPSAVSLELARGVRRRPRRPSRAVGAWQAAAPADRQPRGAALAREPAPGADRAAARLQHAAERREVSGRPARRAARARGRRSRLEGLELDLKELLRAGSTSVPRDSADHVGRAGVAARETRALRSGARDPRLGRPQEPARRRPPLLRVPASRDARRAADLRRGSTDDGDVGRDASLLDTHAPPTSRTRRTRSSTRSRTVRRGSPASVSATR